MGAFRTWVYGRRIRYETAVELDLRGKAERFGEALKAAGFDFEHPTLAAALDGYERWPRKPIRGLAWGASDCAEARTAPVLGNGTYTIYLSRRLGEFGRQSVIALNLTYDVGDVPVFRGLWGTTAEAFDEPPALWIAGDLRGEPGIAAALADDRPFAADLWMNHDLEMERLRWTR